MQINLKKMFKNNGFIIRIDKNGYGKNYQFDPIPEIEIEPNTYFLIENFVGSVPNYKLVKVLSSKEYELIADTKSSVDETIKNIRKGLL